VNNFWPAVIYAIGVAAIVIVLFIALIKSSDEDD
jgi:hypothetical protein